VPANAPDEQLGLFAQPRRLFSCTPSKLGAYEDCASVHTALRSWYALPVPRRTSAALPTVLRATWVSEGYRDGEQERDAYNRALGWLEDYIADIDPQVEPVGVERVVAARTETLALSGRVDRIDDAGDELVIVDYKTGRAELTADDARGSRALALYAYAAERLFRKRCRRVELHHLPTGTVAAHEHTEESLARHLRRSEQAADDIIAAEQAVRDGADPDAAFPTAPGAICSWCDYRRVCPIGMEAPARDQWAGVNHVTPVAARDASA
jgi:putative RecB family exonuclease